MKLQPIGRNFARKIGADADGQKRDGKVIRFTAQYACSRFDAVFDVAGAAGAK